MLSTLTSKTTKGGGITYRDNERQPEDKREREIEAIKDRYRAKMCLTNRCVSRNLLNCNSILKKYF
jgi:hypothetical protein